MLIVADKNIPQVVPAFSKLGEVQPFESHQMNQKAVKDADVLAVRSEIKIDASLLKGSNVRFVASATSGIDHVDLSYLKKNKIGFANAAGANANSVAEYVISSLFSLTERFDFPLAKKTIGVVGVGNIGSRVVKMAKAVGMKVLQNDPPKARMTGEPRFLPLDDLMGCDILTIHVPLTKFDTVATYHLFDKNRFEKMKTGCIFINSSRGAVVETGSLKKAIIKKQISHTVMDVWENEPHIDFDLLKMVDVATSHIAGYSFDGKIKATKMIFESVNHYFALGKRWQPEFQKTDSNVVSLDEDWSLQKLLQIVIRKAYNLERDNENLRKLLMMRENERADAFVRLRSEYPIRREFSNSRVTLPSVNYEYGNIFEALGFQVEIS